MRTDINRPNCWLNMSFIRVLRMEDVDIDIYESFCTEKYVSSKTTNKSVTKVFVSNVFNLLDGKVQDVVGFCNNSSAKLAKLKHKVWYRRGTPDQQYINNVQQKGYGSMSTPGEDGVHTRVLTVPKKIRNQKISGVTSAHRSDRLIVVPIEDFHPTLKALHQAAGHGKERVMLHKVADQYEGLPKSAVVKYISMCMTCNRNKTQVTQAPPRVIISQGLFSRCQNAVVKTCSKTSKSWRMRDFDSRSSHMVRRLTLCSGLNSLNESVVTAIRKFIEELLQNPTNTKIIDLVLFPEVLIHLMAAAEGISYLEAEIIIKDSCHQKLCY